MQAMLDLPLPKMSPGGSAPTPDKPSVPFSPDWWATIPPSFRQGTVAGDGPTSVWLLDVWDARAGLSWTPGGSDWRSGGSACSLSSVLETETIPREYFLSRKACAGILRRAERRGKELPPALRAALMAAAGEDTPDDGGRTM